MRITITLAESLAQQLDSLVESGKATNRSAAIESILEKQLQPTIATAVILAGGSVTKSRAPLLKIQGQYAGSILLAQLKQYGFDQVIFCSHQAGNAALQTRFGDGTALGMHILYANETSPLGTAGALRNILPLLPDQPILVQHADVLTSLNLREFMQFHMREGSGATIAVKPRMGERHYGQVFLQGNRIVKFLKQGTAEGISIVNTGMYVLHKQVLARIPASSKPVFLEKDVFPKLAKTGSLGAFIFQGGWFELSDPAQLLEAGRWWSEARQPV